MTIGKSAGSAGFWEKQMPASNNKRYLLGLLAALPLLVSAQMTAQDMMDQNEMTAEGELPAGAIMQFTPPVTPNVRKLSDSELTCSQIYAETQDLEKAGAEQSVKIDQAQRQMAESQNEMMQQSSNIPGSGIASTVGNSLLGMLPGGGMVSSMAMQAALDVRRSAMQENVTKMMQTQNQLMNVSQSMQYTQARQEHLADLFLKKGCKLSQVKAASAAAVTSIPTASAK
jgi:hypothetical protein